MERREISHGNSLQYTFYSNNFSWRKSFLSLWQFEVYAMNQHMLALISLFLRPYFYVREQEKEKCLRWHLSWTPNVKRRWGKILWHFTDILSNISLEYCSISLVIEKRGQNRDKIKSWNTLNCHTFCVYLFKIILS